MHGIRHTKVPTGCMPCTHSHATVTVVLDGPKLSYSNSRRRPVQRYVPRLYKRDNGLKARIYLVETTQVPKQAPTNTLMTSRVG